jgi:polar amino acid transport system substrate-binding protein/two-component system sensor histidine kinase EvgS
LWFELRASRLEDKRGRATGRLLLLHSINDHKQAEAMMAEARDQALQASLLKSQLIANVSHELRTPLNAILGFTEMLQEGSYGAVTPGQEEVLRLIINSTRQMNLFVGDLLDQSLIEKGKLKLQNAPFSPMDLAGSVRGLYAEEARAKGLDLVFNLDPGLPGCLQGDVRRLQQVLANLVGNAIKFTEEGAVRVRFLRAGAAGWVIEVTDTGIGIPREARHLIFEPFRQIETESGRKNSGAGLGLAIVKHLVTHMGGHIQVESEPGRGSTFRVLLPMTAEAGQNEQTLPQEMP